MTEEMEVAPREGGPDLESLLGTMRKGDPASCRPFATWCAGPLYNYLYWLTGDPEWSVELFQQSMLHTYNNLPRARKAADPEGWIYQTATHIALEQARRRQARQRASWDNILRGGLVARADGRWSRWDDGDSDVGNHPDRVALLVESLKESTPEERAALLLACVVRVAPRSLSVFMGLSRRRAHQALLAACRRTARAQGVPADSPVPGLSRDKLRLALLEVPPSARAQRILAHAGHAEGGPAMRREEEEALAVVRELPVIPPPENLADAAEACLRAGQEAEEERIATWGFRFMQVTVPLFIIAIISLILLPTISRSMEAARQAAGAENLKIIGEALIAYSEQSPGNRFPPIAREAGGAWVPDLRQLYPRYIKDPALLVRPSLNDPALVKAMEAALTQSPPDFDQAHALLARSYVYTGYVLLDESALAAFQSALPAAGTPELEGDLQTADKLLRRLKKDVEYFFVATRSDPQAAAATRAGIPVMFETMVSNTFGRDPDGANVLYLDGHIDYVRFGEKFPVTSGVAALLGERP